MLKLVRHSGQIHSGLWGRAAGIVVSLSPPPPGPRRALAAPSTPPRRPQTPTRGAEHNLSPPQERRGPRTETAGRSRPQTEGPPPRRWEGHVPRRSSFLVFGAVTRGSCPLLAPAEPWWRGEDTSDNMSRGMTRERQDSTEDRALGTGHARGHKHLSTGKSHLGLRERRLLVT